MTPRLLIKLLVFSLVSSFYFVSQSFAATLQVTKIGSMDLGGKMYSEWWYTTASPAFYGKASPSSEVSILIGTDTFKVTSDDGGAWVYNSTLANGDYDLTFTQGQEKVSFKLHLGQTMPQDLGSSSGQSTSSIPATGFNQVVALCMGSGILLLATYFYITGDPRRRSVFEAKILKED